VERTKRVAIYARVSSAGQAKKDLSIPDQVRLVREFCEKRGWRVVEVFEDKGKTGSETVNRPALQRMLRTACLNDHPYDLILTRELSRFGRSDEDAALRKRLRDHGVCIDNITSPSGDMDAALTPTGEFMERITSATDILTRQTSTVHMIAGQKAKARKGGLAGAQATCYGYKQDWVSVGGGKPIRTPVIDKQRAKIVREMFRRYIGGDSLKKITRWLNDLGISAPRGAAWYDSTVRKILSNETYLGRIVYGKIKKVKHPVTRTPVNVLRPDHEVIRGVGEAFPSITDRKTFDKVQKILGRNERTRPEGGHPGNTLRGIGKCAVCGWHLAHQPHTGTGKWYYMCGNVKTKKAANCDPDCKGIVQADYVDEVVELFLRRIMSTEVTDLRAQVARYSEAASNLTGLSATEALDIAIVECEKKIAAFIAAIAKGSTSSKLLAALEQEEAKLAELRQKRETIVASVSIAPIDIDAVLEARSSIKAALSRKDPARTRAILAAIVSEVRCDWSKRKDPAVNFSYAFDGGPRTVRIGILNEDADPLDLSDLRIPGYDGMLSVRIGVPNAPLTFIPKWSITNADQAAEEVLQQIAQALS
jgi:DNA invertase Pin-like site-specific DNA recombinase